MRHAAARTCWVTIDRAGAVLEVRVEDDGTGIAPDARLGVGLHSMRERADELGGTLEVVPRQGGGTGVRAVIPVEAAA